MSVDDSSIYVQEVRCSLVGVSLFTEDSIVRVKNDYDDRFSNAASNIGEWTVPWTDNPHVVFWEQYLEKNRLLGSLQRDNNSTDTCVLSFNKVQGCVVPLRAKNLGKIQLTNKDQLPQQDFTVWTDGLAYPHGVGCIITFRWRSKEGLKLDDMVDQLVELRNESYQWINANSISHNRECGSLGDISQQILNYLSVKCTGEACNRKMASPYTVVTIVEAKNAPLSGKPKANEKLHQVLDAFCTFNRKWRTASPTDLAKALLPTKGEDINDVLYARGRGRAIWLPGYFRQNRSPSKHYPIRYLGRYHRNIALATVQVAYLSLFLQWVNELHHGLTGDMQDWARAAAGAVARLYGPCKNSYMCSSLPTQMLPFRGAINAVREKLIPYGKKLQVPKFRGY